jgi:hypothetical protein
LEDLATNCEVIHRAACSAIYEILVLTFFARDSENHKNRTGSAISKRMTESTETFRLAEEYLQLCNSHLLEAIYANLDDEIVYSSSVVGSFTGKSEVIKMMDEFFAKFEALHWKVCIVRRLVLL